MTSILAFKINDGNQMIVVGDRQHTHEQTTYEDEKIKIFNNILFCGSGFDRLIWEFHSKINNLRSYTRCSNKLLELKKEKTQEYAQHSSGENPALNSSFFIIDCTNICGDKIIMNEKNNMNSIELIGSSSSHIGHMQELLTGSNIVDFFRNKESRALIIKKIIEAYHYLAKHDPFTGHPSLFSLDIWVLSQNQTAKQFKLNFKHKVSEFLNYDLEEKND